jgi:hypothetical protein
VDGINEATGTGGTQSLTAAPFMRLGMLQTGINPFLGTIDDLRIWNVARTEADIQDNLNKTLNGDETGLVAYYKMDQGIAGGNNTAITTLTDSTANGNTGTLFTFALTGNSSNFVTGRENAKCAPVQGVLVPSTSISGTYNISWGHSTTPGVTYVIRENGTPIKSTSELNYVVSGRTGGVYNYTVQATKTGYDASAESSPASTTVTLTCGPITALTAPAINYTGTYNISWTPSSTGCNYTLKENGTTVYSGPSLNYVANGRGNGTYNYTVQATKENYLSSAVVGPASTEVTATCAPINSLTAPATNTTGSYSISWTTSTPGATYVIKENGTVIYTGTGVYGAGVNGTGYYITVSDRLSGTYNYTIQASKEGYQPTAVVGPVSTVVTLTCAAITTGSVPATAIAGNSYNIAWGPSTAGSTYTLKENGTVIYSGLGTNFVVAGKASGSYSYTVQATKSGYLPSPVAGPATTTIIQKCAKIQGIYGPATSTSGSYNISWNSSATAGVTYVLKENGTTIYSGTALNFVVSGKGTGSYSYTVLATKAGNADSDVTGPVTTTVTLTCANVILTAPATDPTGTYNIKWSGSTAGSTYTLKENGVTIYTGTALNFVVSGRINGTYNYTVQASLSGYASSNVASASTAVTWTCGAINSITVPVTVNTTGNYTVSWSNSSTAGVTYKLYESGNATPIYTGTALSFPVTGRLTGSYTYTIKATKSGYVDAVKTSTAVTVTLP